VMQCAFGVPVKRICIAGLRNSNLIDVTILVVTWWRLVPRAFLSADKPLTLSISYVDENAEKMIHNSIPLRTLSLQGSSTLGALIGRDDGANPAIGDAVNR
jgi:hypothetical protein